MKEKSTKVIYKGAPFGGVYLVTYVGAAVYFVQRSTGLFGFIWALLKAMVWPGFVVHNVLVLLRV